VPDTYNYRGQSAPAPQYNKHMQMNTNVISLIALLLSVFFAGSYLRGEWSNSREMKEELRELRNENKEIKKQVESINDSYLADKERLLEVTRNLYGQLDTIISLKATNKEQIRVVAQKVREQETRIEIQIDNLRRTIAQKKLQVIQ
jgi:hypothetical protein